MQERHDRWSVGEWMTSSPVTIPPDCPVRSAFYTMRSRGFRHLMVVENEELVGIVTDRDLRRPDLSDEPYDWNDYYQPDEHYEVRFVMSSPVFTVNPHDPLEKPLRLLIENKIGALPVVDKNNRVIGILSAHDVLRAFDAALATNGDVLRFKYATDTPGHELGS